MHHCVGGYVNNVVDGKTIILFIRKEEEPDKPYYTLEWKGRVIQCHGMCNCDMTEKVKKFVDQFSNEMINYEQELAMAS